MTSPPKTIIVGGGVIGLSIAWELLQRGHSVTVVDQDKIGRGTSWAACGILPPNNFDTATDALDRLRGYSHQRMLDWTKQLQEITGIDCGLRQCGGWYLADTPGEAALMIGMRDYWNDLAIECENVDAASLLKREPELAHWSDQHDKAGIWFTPGEWQIRPPDLLRALTDACKQAGAKLLTQAQVVDVRTTTSDAAILIEDQWITADRVVLCGGSWTGRIADRLNLQTSIVPIRGQILMLRTPTPILKSIVNIGQRYVLCRDDGRTLIGSCEEEVGFDTSTTDEMIGSLHQFALDLCPSLQGVPIERSWSGLRPMTFDGFPMLGKAPGEERLFVAAGHYRSGIHFACGTAALMSDLIEGRTPAINLADFRVGKQMTSST